MKFSPFYITIVGRNVVQRATFYSYTLSTRAVTLFTRISNQYFNFYHSILTQVFILLLKLFVYCVSESSFFSQGQLFMFVYMMHHCLSSHANGFTRVWLDLYIHIYLFYILYLYLFKKYRNVIYLVF